jgi:serine/threonine protein kinase
MQIPQIYCSYYGAANEDTSTLCFVCSSPISQEVETPESAPVLLHQRYRGLTSVGTGGFGTIYKVQDIQRANALFAIKQINLTSLSAMQIIEATEAFHREVRMLSSLHHENLPRIYDSFTDPQHWYMVMDFIEGETLEQ